MVNELPRVEIIYALDMLYLIAISFYEKNYSNKS